MKRLVLAVLATLVAAPALAATDPAPGPGWKLERSVLLLRHGLRTPLETEAAVTGLNDLPLPAWKEPASLLTEHGVKATRLLGAYLRDWTAAGQILPANDCPAEGTVDIWTNSAARTISTGQALAEGLAPGCNVKVSHLPPGTRDPLFSPPSEMTGFKPEEAIASIRAEKGDPQSITAPYKAEIALMEKALGCDRRSPPCDIAGTKATLSLSADGKGIDMLGPIYITSGTAQVFLLQYLEGLPMKDVAWGRLDAGELARVSRLHALLFEVYARPHYMARHTAFKMAPRVLDALSADKGPALTLLIGHDNNVAALSSLLDVHFQVDGYGQDDPPIGGGLRFERWRDPAGAVWVRLAYVAQTPDQIRHLAPLSRTEPPFTEILPIPGCADTGDFCRIDRFTTLIGQALVSR
ncbi:histidine-type phosphatase [Niveispirillum irakense]|uniref:histidine-type phosphatase n=1 Tax=Niveispirillum irakense TaxID=34011 RepID=UPI00048B7F62|nr:histidine-type phosphatase [Niveispirillum irakense]